VGSIGVADRLKKYPTTSILRRHWNPLMRGLWIALAFLFVTTADTMWITLLFAQSFYLIILGIMDM
jgi:hypothetical protein